MISGNSNTHKPLTIQQASCAYIITTTTAAIAALALLSGLIAVGICSSHLPLKQSLEMTLIPCCIGVIFGVPALKLKLYKEKEEAKRADALRIAATSLRSIFS